MSFFRRCVVVISCMLVTVGLANCTAPIDPHFESPIATDEAIVDEDLSQEFIDGQIDADGTNAGGADIALEYSAGRIPAFPGAEGFGAYTPGGRGGRVIEVTNLDDNGPGSLRSAIEAEGPRIVVFRIGGTIELQSQLVIENPFITIAGQTAPGGGIALKTSPENTHAALTIETNDVILRYMRLRPGPSTELSHSVDALTINAGYNIIIDHSSLSWATDEVASTWYDPHDISFQWNIISEGLYNSTHEEGAHSMGLLLGSTGAGNITVHHNLFAHNRSRNPRVKVAEGTVDIANNVIYNPQFGEEGWGTSHVSDDHGRQRVNYVANVVKLGPNGTTPGYYISVGSATYGADLYLEENRILAQDGQDLIMSGDAEIGRNPEYSVSTRQPAPTVMVTDPYRAIDDVLAQAGANFPVRDPVDMRIVADVINGTGHWIDDPAEVGGWPVLDAGTPPEDTDHDGMPDGWEDSHGLDPADPTDGNGDSDGDGYTNVEQYLNQITP